MYLDDFVAREFLQELFDAIKAQTMAQMPAEVDFDLCFSNENDLRIFAAVVPAPKGEWRFCVVVTERLLQYITRYFFAYALSVSSLSGISILNPGPSGVPHAWIPEIESLEVLLNQIPNDVELPDERVDIFLECLKEAWTFLFLHETAHITEGHLGLMYAHPELFENDGAFSRACELEADDRAAVWMMARTVVNPPDWMRGDEIVPGVWTISTDFTLLIVSILFYSMRIRRPLIGGGGQNYLPDELRQSISLITMAQKSASSRQDRFDACLRAMTGATRVTDVLVGWPERALPTLVFDIPLENQVGCVSGVIEEYQRLSPQWTPFRFRVV
ncbi:hypothetical protein ACWKW9_02025 [Rhizobium daejeonense]